MLGEAAADKVRAAMKGNLLDEDILQRVFAGEEKIAYRASIDERAGLRRAQRLAAVRGEAARD